MYMASFSPCGWWMLPLSWYLLRYGQSQMGYTPVASF